jgi:hypothetical protein
MDQRVRVHSFAARSPIDSLQTSKNTVRAGDYSALNRF